MTIKMIKPNNQILRDYVYGEMSEEDQRALELWLVFNTEESVLDRIQELEKEKKARLALLSKCFKKNIQTTVYEKAHNFLTSDQLKLFLQSTKDFLGTFNWEMMPPKYEFAFQTLSGDKHGADDTGTSVIEIQANEKHEIQVKIYKHTYYAVFILDSSDKVYLVPGDKNNTSYHEKKHEPETYNELQSISMNINDDPLQIWIIFDSESQVPIPPKDTNILWFVKMLEKLIKRRTVDIKKYILKVAPVEPDRR